MVGKLIYLSHTRPDIAYAMGVVSQFMHQPRKTHMEAVLRIVRYLKGTAGHGILFKPNKHLETQLYTDADWAGDKDNRRSTAGYLPLSVEILLLVQQETKSGGTIKRRSRISRNCKRNN